MEETFTFETINFSESSLVFLNISLAFIMFGVALSINRQDFVEIKQNPKSVFTGAISQFILLPAATFALIYFAKPIESLALGMILVAACPGGNLSNFFSQLSRGNIALSISLTAVASVLAAFMTPLNYEFWSNLYIGDKVSQSLDLDTFKMFKIVFLVLVIPLFTGLWFSSRFPVITRKINLPIRIFSFFFLIGFIVIAFMNNIELFSKYYVYIIYLVFFHNALALGLGYLFSKSVGNSERDSRTISIETGIQNSALGLVIIFTLFDGNGGMALITAWWGIWHIIAGISLSLIFTKGRIFDIKTT